ncbi:uncharacterized protein LOC119076212 [Bradysia coprophila]|uniref:uncharacterized protein LOC119076212 n=1 Tax=Bradysia coprophila TaxID=38358 RepID=UPI00187D9ADC|nr:uncharacterized protein LOC119076212 [Bradysia coprophila]
MTSQIRQMLTQLFGTPEYRVLILGFDASGKTSILYKFKLNKFLQTIPTIGFNVETIKHNNSSLTIWDVGGCDKIRPLLRHYFANTKGIIFVIDSQENCQYRRLEIKDELWRIFGEETLHNVPVLIYLNKMDVDDGLQPYNIINEMKLNELKHRQWFVQSCSAKTGIGLYEGLNWLVNAIKSPTLSAAEYVYSNRMEDQLFEEKSLLWLSQVDDDTNEEFIEKLESRKMGHFDHRVLLRSIWIYLKTIGRRKTIELIFPCIKAYNTDCNETLVYFWIQIVHYAIEATTTLANDFAGFLLMNPQLLNEAALPLTYYKRETLFSDQAKTMVVLPDLKHLPSIVPSSTRAVEKPLEHQEPSVVELSDDDFLNNFESCTLTNWSHKTHLRMAWLYLTRNERRVAVNKIFDGIKNFIQTSPIARKTTFHFTMTYFWIQMIDAAIAQSPKDLGFETFISVNQHLMNGGLFLEYYTKDTLLNNPIARQEMVLPDVKPLPSVILRAKVVEQKF